MWRAERDAALALAAALLSALVAVTCHRGARLELAPAVAGPKSPRVVSSVDAGPAGGLASPEPAGSAVSPRPASAGALGLTRFDAALAGLEAKTRAEPVRILWLGDSHTAADYLTGAARRRLELRFGAGGPGFVRLGTSPYRHDGVRVVRDGKWRTEPEPPARRTLAGDGVFGLGGLRAQPLGKDARVEIRVDPKRVRGTVRYELVYQAPQGSSFRLSVGKKQELVDAHTEVEHAPGSALARLRREAPAGDALEIAIATGEPRFYGLFAEGSESGVVLDTLGIDGARVATPLAWNAEALAAEVAARRPELLVLAYGTNEAFDPRGADAIVGELGELVSRIRRGAPDVDCLIVGPPDAAAPDLASLPRLAEIDTAERRAAATSGCGYFSLYTTMGGDGSFARWMRETPPLARADRIHLTVPGYERLGEALATTLIEGYEERARP